MTNIVVKNEYIVVHLLKNNNNSFYIQIFSMFYRTLLLSTIRK